MQFIDPEHNPFASLSPAVWRASTIVFDNFEEFVNRKSRQPDGYSYGMTGTPTTRELERRISVMENARHSLVLPSGQAALMMAVMGFIRGGDHLLISDSCYGALKTFSRNWLSQMGITVEFYPPAIGAEIESLIRPNTRMICLESPGTVTMEMQEIDTVVAIAKKYGIKTVMDNTWASPLYFRPLDHGIDLSVEAASKLFSGHSDLLLGSISLNSRDDYTILRETQSILGLYTSPEDCFLVLRGLETFELRTRAQSESAFKLAKWVSEQPQVKNVLFPALDSDPGHKVWKRLFSGSGCLFSFIFNPAKEEAISAFFNALKHFPIGASWGGTRSLIAYYPDSQQKARAYSPTDEAIIRISVGLEDTDLLIADLQQAFTAWQQVA